MGSGEVGGKRNKGRRHQSGGSGGGNSRSATSGNVGVNASTSVAANGSPTTSGGGVSSYASAARDRSTGTGVGSSKHHQQQQTHQGHHPQKKQRNRQRERDHHPAATSSVRSSSSNGVRHRDPAVLLARGYTGRCLGLTSALTAGSGSVNPVFLGSGNNSSAFPLTTLSVDEIDKDLRHMQAYYSAVCTYRQQFYMSINRSQLAATTGHPENGNTTSSNGNSSSPTQVASSSGAAVVDGAFAASSQLAGAHAGGAGAPHHIVAAGPGHPLTLPVRIDPEEEKRLQVLRLKIAKAEFAREEAEQHYVALRAHYVQVSRDLNDRLETQATVCQQLQRLVYAGRGKAVAMQRVRLQMARDILAVLKRRWQILQQENDQEQHEESKSQDQQESVAQQESTGPVDSATPSTPTATPEKPSPDAKAEATSPSSAAMSTTTPSPSPTKSAAMEDNQQQEQEVEDAEELEAIWNMVEENLKEAVEVCHGNDKVFAASAGGSCGNNNNTGKRSVNNKRNKFIPWPCTKLPATPRNVPILLSATSRRPEKSLAIKAGNIFQSNPHSLCWTDPDAEGYERGISDVAKENSEGTTEGVSEGGTASHSHPCLESVVSLREEVNYLESELRKERILNQKLSHKISLNRTKHDEWVAFLALVRQETESVLHRHNVILESDVATAAAEQLHHEKMLQRKKQQEEEEKEAAAQAAAADNDESKTDPSGSCANGTVKDSTNCREGSNSVATTTVTTAAATSPRPTDDANDGDDELGSNDDEEDMMLAPKSSVTGEWTAAAAAGSKRSGSVDNDQEELADADANRKRQRKL